MITLSSEQQSALSKMIELVMSDSIKELAVLGYSGAGKTTLVKTFLTDLDKILATKAALSDNDYNPFVCVTATTNKAAKVIGDLAGRDSSTIQSLLGLILRKDYKTGKEFLSKRPNSEIVRDSLIIIDEASMIDHALFKLIKENTINCKIIYILDPAQLLSVTATSCYIEEKIDNKVYLTEIQRQAEIEGKMNPIAQLGQHYRKLVSQEHEEPLELFFEDYDCPDQIEFVDSYEDYEAILLDYYNRGLLDGTHAKSLTWSNKRSIYVNDLIRSNYTNSDKIIVGETLISNSMLMQTTEQQATRDIKTVKAETILTVESLTPFAFCYDKYDKLSVSGQLARFKETTSTYFIPDNTVECSTILKQLAKSKNWPCFFALKEAIADVRPVFSSTVHKAQGSTFDTAFLDVTDISKCPSTDTFNRLMYVGATRPRTKLYVKV